MGESERQVSKELNPRDKAAFEEDRGVTQQ